MTWARISSKPTPAIFRPRLLACLRGNTRSDLAPGLTLGVIALSLSMALGIASGATPAMGIVSGFLISALGGSRVSIGGPTAAFIPVVVAVAQAHGADNLIICTALAGLMLMALGFARMGTMFKYIPMPVIAGFTAGISVYILSTQLRDFLGLRLAPAETVPADFIHQRGFIARHLGDIHWPAAIMALLSAESVKFWPASRSHWVPPSLAAVLLGTVIAALLPLWVETIGTRFGPDAIPQSLSRPHRPVFIRRVSETTQITSVDERALDLAPEDSLHGKAVPQGVLVYQVAGAFLFGTPHKLETALRGADRQPEVLILGMKRVMAMDATG